MEHAICGTSRTGVNAVILEYPSGSVGQRYTLLGITTAQSLIKVKKNDWRPGCYLVEPITTWKQQLYRVLPQTEVRKTIRLKTEEKKKYKFLLWTRRELKWKKESIPAKKLRRISKSCRTTIYWHSRRPAKFLCFKVTAITSRCQLD